MPSRFRTRIGAAVRALLIALWAVAVSVAPAHAAADAIEDPCQHPAAVAGDATGDVLDSALGSSDLDHEFHAAHDCGTCHVHVLSAPAHPLKPVLRSATCVFANAAPAASLMEARGVAGGVMRPAE